MYGKIIIVIVLYACIRAVHAYNCTVQDPTNFNPETTGLAGYYKRYIINNPVTQYDLSSNNFESLDKTESLRFAQNALTVKNATSDYATLYSTTGQLFVSNKNNTLIRNLETSVTYTVSGCIGSLGHKCRWTAPVVCAQTTNDELLLNTSAYVPAVNQKLICAPVLMEWVNNNAIDYVNNTVDVVQNAFRQASNIDWKKELQTGSILTTPLTDIPAVYATSNRLAATGRSGKTGTLKYQPNIRQCPLDSKPRVFTVRDQQNLETSGGIACYKTGNGATVLVQGSGISRPVSYPCNNVSIAIILETFSTGNIPATSMMLAYPPNTPESYMWRPLFGFSAANLAQDPILNSKLSDDVIPAMTYIGLCSNICAARDTILLTECDVLCYAVLDKLIQSNIANNLTIPLDQNECEQLDYTKYEYNTTDISVACREMTNYYNGFSGGLPTTNPVSKPSSVQELISFLEIQTIPNSNGYDIPLCNEVLLANNKTIQTEYSYLSSTVSNGQYTGAACGLQKFILSDLTQAGTALIQQLFDRETSYPYATYTKITDNILLTNWLQLLQAMVLSLLASLGLLKAGSHSGKIDSIFNMALNAITRCNAATHGYKRQAVWLLNFCLVIFIILINVTAYANIVQSTLSYAATQYDTSTQVELVTLENSTFVVESVHKTRFNPRVWPGVVMWVFYTIVLFVMFVWQIWNMCKIKWENRSKWLSEQSWDDWEKNNKHLVQN